MDEKQLEEVGRFIAKTASDAEASAVEKASRETLEQVRRLTKEIDDIETEFRVELEGYSEQLKAGELRDQLSDSLYELKEEQTSLHQAEIAALADQMKAQEVFEAQLTKRLAEIKDGEKGIQGEQGEAGVDGLDRPLLEPVELVTERTYPKNTLGTHSGGLWIATKEALGDPESDPHAWHCILDAMTEVDFELGDDQVVTMSVRTSTGEKHSHTAKFPFMTYEDVWEEGKSYSTGQVVTKGASMWIAKEATDGCPPGNGWKQILHAKQGKPGPRGEKGETGPQGVPGRNGTDAKFPTGYLENIEAMASERKAFEDGRSDAYAITSHRGYFLPQETYRSGDVVDFDGSLFLCTSGGSWSRWADAVTSFEAFVTIPKVSVANYMLWQGNHETGRTYSAGFTVKDDQFTMVALRETDDTAAPIPEGDPLQVYAGADPVWTTDNHTGHVYSVLEVAVPTDGLYEVSALRVWLQGITADDHYQVLVQDSAGVFRELASFDGDVLGSPGWFSLNESANFLTPGSTDRIWLHQWNSNASDSQTFPWVRGANNNANVDPGSGNWTTRNTLAQLRINFIDNEGADRESVVTDSGLIGSVVRLEQADDANKWLEFVINSLTPDTGFVWYGTTSAGTGPSGEPDIGAVCNINLKVPTEQPTTYVTLAGHLTQFQTLQSYVSLDDPSTGLPSNNGVGIDLTFQSYYASPDWGLVAYSGSGSGTPAADELSQQDISWVRSSSEPFLTATVSTTNQSWTTIETLPVPAGSARKAIFSIDGKRTDGIGFFTGEFRALAWHDGGGVDVEQSAEIKLGDNRDIRVVANGDAIDLQVQGKNNEDWDWSAVIYYREVG
jgi:hypothetical protein